MKVRYLFVYTSLLMLFANGAFAEEGSYQRTKDGNTLVWNSFPLTGETVEWSGSRDKEGYASGRGTVTWYKLAHSGYTFVKKNHSIVSARYTGKMVKGKLEGAVEKVSVGPKLSFTPGGKTSHAIFTGGNRTGEWVAGPAAITSEPSSPSPTRVAVDQTTAVKAPAEGPSSVAPQSAKQKTPVIAKKETASIADDSVQSVAAPPSSLKSEPPAEVPPQETAPSSTSTLSGDAPTLSAPDAVQFADAEARANGYDLRKYQNPQVNYIAASDTWSVSYNEKHIDGRTDNSKRFSVMVEDKSKKTALTKGK